MMREGRTSAGRRGRIIRLLETRDQHLPTIKPRRDTPAAGFVHDTLAPAVCPTCEGVDSHACTGCGGRGEVETRRSKDPYAVEKVQPYGMTPARHEAARERDAVIGRLERQTREPWASPGDELADANQHPYGWETARRRMYRQHDYAALDLAMEALRLVDEEAYEVLHELYVHHRLWQKDTKRQPWHIVPSPTMRAVVDRALSFVDQLMPDPIRAPDVEQPVRVAAGRVERAAGDRALSVRNSEIRAAIDQGASTSAVAERWGLTVNAVNRAYRKGDAT